MFQRVRKHINPATVLAFAALVFAITGGAFAATGGSSGNGSSHGTLTASAAKAKAKPKAKPGPRGPAGPKGATGATGAAGPQGPAGAAGAAGAKGENGAGGSNGVEGHEGKAGADGKSVSVEAVKAGGSECGGNGGALVKQEGAPKGTEVCNGQTGFTETLPPGKTEMGSWAGNGVEHIVSISFSIPLGVASVPAHYIYEEGKEVIYNETSRELEEVTQSACAGSYKEPSAEPGNLCIYAHQFFPHVAENPEFLWAPELTEGTGVNADMKADRSGTLLFLKEGSPEFDNWGDWAVTEPTK